MLVFVSDLHLTDGSSGQTISTDAFRILRKQLCNLAYAASWRTGVVYKPIDELHLVLLGDILDVIRSNQWTAPGSSVRPWSNTARADFVDKVEGITKAILARNTESLAVLKSIAHGGRVVVPETSVGYGVLGASDEKRAVREVPVKVHTHYQVGNHDWFYHLSGDPYNRIRTQIVDAMGLANTPGQPFPHDPNESAALKAVYRDHDVWARHGDVHDVFNCMGSRDASSLGDAIVVELLNRFPDEVERRMAGQLPPACVDGLREVDNVRPLPLIPVWIDGLLRRTCTNEAQIIAVKRIWNELADAFLANPSVHEMKSRLSGAHRLEEFELELVLRFTETASLGLMSRIVARIQRFISEGDTPGFKNALNEDAFKSRAANFIVYGHTHHHKIVPLDYSGPPNQTINKFYINSGTWRRVYELAQSKPADQEFLGYNVMTYLLFFKGDERGGRPFETWSGALACD